MMLQHTSAPHAAAKQPCRASRVPPSSVTKRPVLAAAQCRPSLVQARGPYLPPLPACLQQQQQRQQQQQQRWVCYSSPAEGSSGAPPEEEDFDLLSNRIAELQQEVGEELKGCSIYLIGMMGSGKSTLGKMISNTLKYAFFDTDNVIELAHPNMTVSDIFKQYGEEYFRNCERQVLKELAPYKQLVVSTGGGAVKDPMNWSYMHNGIVAWLQGDADLLARRVVAEGVEKRPLLYGEGVTKDNAFEVAQKKLEQLLEERSKFYENADVFINLEGHGQDVEQGAPTAVVMYRLLIAVRDKIMNTKQEREARRNLVIENAGDVPTMQKMQSPKPSAFEE